MREVITKTDVLQDRLIGWLGRDFAFDVETSGLDYQRDRLLGVALTFAEDESYYIVLAHTVEEQRTVQTTTTTKTLAGYTEKKRGKAVVQVPIFEEREVPTERVETIYPLQTFVDEQVARILLSALFSQPEVLMIAHNAKFDLHFLERFGIAVCGRLADTMLAAQLLNENADVGLKSLGERVGMTLVSYKDLPHYPSFKADEFLGVPLEHAADYAMRDTEATYRLWQVFRQELAEQDLARVFTEIWMPLLVVLQRMERRGVVLDVDKLRQLLHRYHQERDRYFSEIEREGLRMVLHMVQEQDPRAAAYARMAAPGEVEASVVTEDGRYLERYGLNVPLFRPTPRSEFRIYHFNPGSTQHVGDLLYSWYKLELPKDIRTSDTNGGRPVDKNTLKTFRLVLGEQCPPIIDTILKYREASKLISTYFENFLRLAEEDAEHAVRTTFNQHITDSGRLSSSDPINLQNVPARGEYGKLVRDIFRARPGHKLIVADLSMAELRMLAHYSQDATMMQAFAMGQDLHVLTGSRQAGIPYEDLFQRVADGDAEAKRIRQIGKTSNFCVPLDTLCLTRDGWKSYAELTPGEDETIGFNPITGESQWTTIRDVLVFEPSEVVNLSNQYWSAVTTPEHRWYGYRYVRSCGRYYEVPRFLTTAEISTHTVIRLAGPLSQGGTHAMTDEDATVLAWLWASSDVENAETVAETLPSELRASGRHVGTIDKALRSVPHQRIRTVWGAIWRIAPEWRERFIRAYALDTLSPEQLVLQLSPSARLALFEVYTRAPDAHGFMIRSGRETPMIAAIRLLHYLMGFRPSGTTKGQLRLCKPYVTGQRLQIERAGCVPVWCVRTDLGTWTMRQGREIALTGNSLMYGMGARKYQAMLWLEQGIYVSLDEARRLIDEYNALYAGATAWKERVIRYAKQLGYTRSIAGRRRRLVDLYANDINLVRQAERIGVNFVIQGSVADLMATAMIAIDRALNPIGGRILLQVHDELVCEVPEEYAGLGARIVSEYMSEYLNQKYKLRVPMVADAGIGDTWYSAKE